MSDESILQKCGPDAVQYLSFQRHILFYMSVMMVISLGVVLPINFQGTLQGDETNFGHTTLSNLDPNSPWLWVHVTLAILYLPLGIIIMRRFSITLKLEEEDGGVSRTLMITNIPRTYCDTADLQRHFREKNYQAKLYCENYLKRTGVRLNMRPYLCGNACKCCGCRTVDAIEYYSEEESRFRGALEDERTTALKRPLGIAFVTLTSIEAAQKMYADHRPTCKCENNPSSSSVSRHLEPHRENLSLPSKYWYVKAVIVNLFLFIVLFFLTTPAIVVNFLKPLAENGLEKMSAVVSEFLPTLLLWTVSALMPVLVSYSDRFLSHWTRSEQNHSIMNKTFTLLLFMVLILPSLGLTRYFINVKYFSVKINNQYINMAEGYSFT
uniref:CSC1-like protein 2 n=1 Tax=Timema shepardi TaxID=629360 RepID=A0A7R9AQF5_TIMSH|nr:unnamed protein product [Timema shepardi]